MLRSVDLMLFLPAAFLVALGGVILSSVSPSSFPQQFVFIALATLSFFVVSNINFRVLKAISPGLYVVSIILLLATVLFGAFIRGAARWIEIGPIVFQPSEVIKPLLLLFFTHLISAQTGSKRFLTTILAFVPAFVLIFIQPDLGSAIVLASGTFGILFFGGVPIVWFVSSLLLFIVSLPILWRLLADYQKQRIYTFLSPFSDPFGAGYNSIQAMIAIGSGGFWGRGLGQGTQSQLAFLPERHTDFVFAALSEELGFLAGAGAIFAFAIILARIIVILKKTDDVFSQALLGGIFFVFFTHIVVNICMNLGVLPVTGIPLPFVSSGGSALISMSAMLGLASHVSSTLKIR